MIHPTAVVHPGAQLGKNVRIGPCAVIDEHVIVGDDCRVGPHVFLTGHTTIGRNNHIHAGAVIGDAPQDLKYQGEPTRLVIGEDNVIREHVTIHRSSKVEEATVVGSNCLLMAGAHVAHNCRLGDHVILANGTLLGGHVTIQNRVFLSGNCLVHQFVTIGAFAMMQGGAGISLDLPPFCVATGNNQMCGLNTVGLRRAGFTSEQRLELRRLYQALFRRKGRMKKAIADLENESLSDPGRQLLDFVKGSRRGTVSHGRGRQDGIDDGE